MFRMVLVPVCAIIGATACVTRPVSSLDPKETGEEITTMSLTNRNVDILFVIDNSLSMRDEQDALVANFDDFMTVLRGIEGGLPDVHIGVISSDVGLGPGTSYAGCVDEGDDGILHRPATCQVLDRYIEDVANTDGSRKVNYAGTLEEAFGCLARTGTNGCGFEQHLEAARRALVDRRDLENQGFLRDDAYLAIVFIADEDDCSATDPRIFSLSDDDVDDYGPIDGTDYRCTEWGVTCAEGDLSREPNHSYTGCEPREDSLIAHPSEYVEDFIGLKPSPSLVMVAGITGDPAPFFVGEAGNGNATLDPSCTRSDNDPTTDDSTAEPAVRLRWFLDQFPDENSTSASICTDRFDAALADIAAAFALRFKPCLLGDLDTTDINEVMPGLQLDCQVSDVLFKGTADEVETVIPRCPMTDATTPDTTTLPCWWTEIDAEICTDSTSHVAIHVERGGERPPVGTSLVARCAR
jgi:hypothetical protein